MAGVNRWRKVLPLDTDELMTSAYVQAMTLSERAGFLWLVMHQWRSEDGFLRADEDYLRSASGLGEEWAKARRALMNVFTMADGKLCYAPVRAQWERDRQKHEAMSEGGRRGLGKRWSIGRLQGSHSPEDGEPAKQDLSLGILNAVYGNEEDKSKSSVIRAIKGESPPTERRSGQLQRNAQPGGSEAKDDEEAISTQNSPEYVPDDAQNALYLEVLACPNVEHGEELHLGDVEPPESDSLPQQTEDEWDHASVASPPPGEFYEPPAAEDTDSDTQVSMEDEIEALRPQVMFARTRARKPMQPSGPRRGHGPFKWRPPW